jgi:hypothetical protein
MTAAGGSQQLLDTNQLIKKVPVVGLFTESRVERVRVALVLPWN